MGRKIVIDVEDLCTLLEQAQKYKCIQVYKSDANRDGEGVWHCDIALADTLEEIADGGGAEMWSFDEEGAHNG